jgi:predicted molibdopterin-dependent oxidoreductase YjgC
MGVWLRPAPRGEIATVAALGRMLAASLSPTVEGLDAAANSPSEAPGVPAEDLGKASSILQRAAHSEGSLAIVYAPNPASPSMAAEAARAVANLAILCRGDRAPESLYVMPVEANVNGIRDMGVRPVHEAMSADRMLREARALLVLGDNPAMFARDVDAVRASLSELDCLVTIDSLQTDTVKLAHVAFADLPSYGKEGTFTSADHRVGKLNPAEGAAGDQTDSLQVLHALADALATRLGKRSDLPGPAAAEVMSEIAGQIPGYAGARYDRLESGVTRAIAAEHTRARVQQVNAPAVSAAEKELVLLTARTLYTSLEGASMHSPEADKLHREEFLEINPNDAMALGIAQNHPVVVQNGGRPITLSAALSDATPRGAVFLPLYFDGGLVNALLHADEAAPPTVTVRPA